MMKKASRASMLKRINAELDDHRGQLAMLMRFELSDGPVAGGVLLPDKKQNNIPDLEFRKRMILRIARIGDGAVKKISDDGLFEINTGNPGVVTCVRVGEDGKFSSQNDRKLLDFPYQSVFPVAKKAPSNLTLDEMMALLDSRSHGVGILGTRAVCMYFINDFEENPESNAADALNFALKTFGIASFTSIRRPDVWEKRRDSLREQLDKVQVAINKLVPVELHQLKSELERQKNRLDTMIEIFIN